MLLQDGLDIVHTRVELSTAPVRIWCQAYYGADDRSLGICNYGRFKCADIADMSHTNLSPLSGVNVFNHSSGMIE